MFLAKTLNCEIKSGRNQTEIAYNILQTEDLANRDRITGLLDLLQISPPAHSFPSLPCTNFDTPTSHNRGD